MIVPNTILREKSEKSRLHNGMFVLIFAVLMVTNGCSGDVVDHGDVPDDTPITNSGLVAFVIFYGGAEIPDSTHLALAPFNDPLSYEIIAIGNNFIAPRFSPNKENIVFMDSEGGWLLRHYSVGQDSIDSQHLSSPVPGDSRTVTWLDNDRFIFSNPWIITPYTEVERFFGTRIEFLNSGVSAGSTALTDGKVIVHTDPHGSNFSLYDPNTKEPQSIDWFDDAFQNGWLRNNHLDFSPSTNTVIGTVIPSGDTYGPRKVFSLNTEDKSIEIYSSGSREYHMGYPRWVSEAEIIYIASEDERNPHNGDTIYVLNTQTRLSEAWISKDDIPGASGVGSPDY